MSEHKMAEAARSKGIYLLPNLFTTAGLFSGFYAVVASMQGHFTAAAVAIFIAMLFDGLDGRIARLTNTQSAFGAEYDSMADMVSFGIAPALVSYNWALSGLGKIGWLVAFVFAASAALRLARFNTQVGVADKRYFQGLASPAAAAIVAGLVWLGSEYDIEGHSISWIAAAITLTAGLLMVSNFRYPSFKEVDWKGKVSFLAILIVLAVLVVVSIEPALILFTIFSLYALSGPVITIRSVKKLRIEHVVGDEDMDDADFECQDKKAKQGQGEETAEDKKADGEPKADKPQA